MIETWADKTEYYKIFTSHPYTQMETKSRDHHPNGRCCTSRIFQISRTPPGYQKELENTDEQKYCPIKSGQNGDMLDNNEKI